MKFHFPLIVLGVWIAMFQPLSAQTFFVQPSNPQPQIVPQKKPAQIPPINPATPINDQTKVDSKTEAKVEEIPLMFRDRAILLVDMIPRGDAVACTLSMRIRNLTGNLVDTSTPWKCRLSDLGGGVKQVETVVFEKLVENGNPSPAKFRPTYVYLQVGAKLNSQTAMARQQAQAEPQKFTLPFGVVGGFGVASN
jgi:hypothetical protein